MTSVSSSTCPVTPATNPGRVYEVLVSRSRKAYAMPQGVRARNDVAVACDDYRRTLKSSKPGDKVKLVNTKTGQTLASTTVTK